MTTQTKKLTQNIPSIRDIKSDKKFLLNLNVLRYATDSNGEILAAGAIPVAERKSFPFHLFGEFDRQSGYAIADGAVKKRTNTNLFSVYVHGVSTPLFYFSANATIYTKLKKGDIVFIYVDDVNAPNIFTFVILQAVTSHGGFASLVSQTNISQLDSNNWGAFKMFGLRYSFSHRDQLSEPLFSVFTRFDGAYKTNPINPESFYIPQTSKQDVVIIPIEAVINQYFGISGYINFNNPLLNLSFELYV